MLRRLFREWLYADANGLERVTPSQPELNRHDATHITIFPAIGGQIVEFSRYDRKTDNMYSTRYIITKDEDIGDRLSKIITLENLKN